MILTPANDTCLPRYAWRKSDNDRSRSSLFLAVINCKRTLEAAGLTMDNLLSVQIFCSDVSLFQQFNAVYRTYFAGEFPARAFLGSGKLLFDARFEVQGIAGK